MVLALHNVGLAFGETELFSGLSLSVGEGQSVAVVGPSGSGKSTLLACIAGTARPTSGSVVVAGTDMTSAPDGDRAKVRSEVIGQIFQDPHLLEELTVFENVAFPLRFGGMARADAQHRAREALEDAGVAHLADRWTSRLSGGEAQRTAVARALAPGCRLLLADEPTAALDRVSAAKVTDAILDAADKHGAAVVISTHDLRVADRCHRVLDLTALSSVTAQ